MFFRFRISIALALLLAMMLEIPVLAGGWAVITLDSLPTHAVAGESLLVGFTVRQHGRTPMADLTPVITASLSNSDIFVVNAKPEGEVGHYAATLIFPKEGTWSWSIQAFTMEQEMPELNVAASVIASASQPASGTTSLVLVVRVLAFAIGLVVLALAYLRRNRLIVGLAALCLVVGVASFVMRSSVTSSVEAQSKESVEAAGNSSVSQAELGRELFIAKGCITCHVNTRASLNAKYWTIDMGAPNLSEFSADPGYLDKWLSNPSALKPSSLMPNLQLSESERSALIAFINSK
jgi:Cytochrome c